MAERRRGVLLVRRDATASGNWTVTPSPDPNPSTPTTHPLNPAHHGGPPYASTAAVVGGVPTVKTDVPVAAVLLALFVASAAAHMTVLQLNKRAGLKFLFSGMLFALCVLRSAALCMRLAWASHPRTADVAMAAGVLTQTGSVLVFVINMILAQRVVRAYHPRLGWHPATALVFGFLIACVVASLLMVVAVTVQTFFTLDAAVRRADRTVQLFAGTYMAVLAFLPIPIVVLAARLPRARRVEKFGAGRWRSKLRLLLFTSALATLGAVFRVSTGFAPRPLSHPAWYHSRVCYYCFNFATDLVISAAYLFSRFDRRFIVPNGAKGPGDYGRGVRVRPPSVASSNGGEGGNETDPEKLAKLKDDDDDKDKGKGKGKAESREVDGVEERVVDPSGPSSDAQMQMNTPGVDLDGMPWPFRPSWAGPHSSEPMPSPSPACQFRTSDGARVDPSLRSLGHQRVDDSFSFSRSSPSHSPIDSPSPSFHSADDISGSSHWGGDISSTYIPELRPAHLRTQQHPHPHQLLHGHTVFGQAITSDEEIHLSTPWPAASAATADDDDDAIWPFTSETQASGRDPIRRSRSSVIPRTYAHAGARTGISRTLSHHRCVNRSQSRMKPGYHNIEGGWI
ncbi:hypothetical protein F5B17DRAFT_432955 [Nemania serpens]|nr:hypothetical protein F5B17DRAFT_432955 [Nemania serpens]